MDAVVNPPQPNEPSYDLHEKVTDAFLDVKLISVFLAAQCRICYQNVCLSVRHIRQSCQNGSFCLNSFHAV